MSKTNYSKELILSLQRENKLLTKEVSRLELKIKRFNKPCCDATENVCSDIGVYKKYLFKNGKEYEIAKADKNGTLIFKEAIFEAPYDEDNCNKWETSSLKRKLEDWWDKFAPEELKANYDVTILYLEEILPDSLLPDWLRGKGEQLEIFKDIKERVKNLKGEETLTWYWTKTSHRSNGNYQYNAIPTGSYSNYYALNTIGVVPACVPHQ